MGAFVALIIYLMAAWIGYHFLRCLCQSIAYKWIDKKYKKKRHKPKNKNIIYPKNWDENSYS